MDVVPSFRINVVNSIFVFLYIFSDYGLTPAPSRMPVPMRPCTRAYEHSMRAEIKLL